MRTKEFIRINIETSPQDVRAWLESIASVAHDVGKRAYTVCRIDPSSTPSRLSHLSPVNVIDNAVCFGVYLSDDALALTAELHYEGARSIVLEIRRDEIFPLVGDELMDRLMQRYPGAKGEILAERPRTSSGAPPLACNVWLEEQLSELAHPEHYHHLYPTWLAHYVTLKGFAPIDPRRSFRAAAKSCLHRLAVRQ